MLTTLNQQQRIQLSICGLVRIDGIAYRPASIYKTLNEAKENCYPDSKIIVHKDGFKELCDTRFDLVRLSASIRKSTHELSPEHFMR